MWSHAPIKNIVTGEVTQIIHCDTTILFSALLTVSGNYQLYNKVIKTCESQVQQHTPVTTVLGKWRKEDQELKVIFC